MMGLIGNKDQAGSMFGLVASTDGNTDSIDTLRNTIRTGGNEDAPTKDGKPDPEGEWKALKEATTVTVNGESQEGIKRPLSVVSNLLKKKKKILQQERAEVNGLRTSNRIKTRQVDGMSLHYIAWVLAGLAIGGIVVKNLSKPAI